MYLVDDIFCVDPGSTFYEERLAISSKGGIIYLMTDYLEQNDHPVPCIEAIVLNEKDEVLLIKRARDSRIFAGRWELIGGKMEVADNNLEEALKREVLEETGLKVEPVFLVDVLAEVPSPDPRYFAVQTIFTAKVVGGKLAPTVEASDFKWLPLELAMKEKLAFNHNRVLAAYKKRKNAGKLIPAQRRMYTDNFNKKDFLYSVQNSYPRFATNAIVLNDKGEILMAKRARPSFIGSWDLPGGHIFVDETLEQCLKREVKEELGVDCEVGELFRSYSDKGRNPRFAVGSAAYFTKLKSENFEKNIEMNDFAYFSLEKLPEKIAYHNDILLADLRDYLKKR